MNPLNFTGVEFLKFYAAALLLATCIAFVMRWLLSRGSGVSTSAKTLTASEMAMLAGGRARGLQTALLGLLHAGSAKSSGAGTFKLCDPLARPSDPIELAVVRRLRSGDAARLGEIGRSCSDELDAVESSLVNNGLVVERASRLMARLIPAGIVALVGVYGLLKINVGMSRHKPVGFLVVAEIITGLIAVIYLAKSPWRTSSGAAALNEARTDEPPAEKRAAFNSNYDGSDLLLMNMAMYGPTTLVGTPYEPLQQEFKDVSPGSGSSGSSCGGSSCGGGGGGCGGGGCGGCGGS